MAQESSTTNLDEDDGSPIFLHTVSNVGSKSFIVNPEENVDEDQTVRRGTPQRKRRPLRIRFGLSQIFNFLVLGLGSYGAYRGWQSQSMQMTVEFGAGLAWGIWTGLSCVGKYKKIRRKKDVLRCSLAEVFSKQHLKTMVKNASYWVCFEEEEKVESLNRMVGQMWPFYERAICKQVISTVEPLLDQFKPPFVNSIKFSKLTFGDMPFKFTHMKIVRVTDDEVVLEAGVRWGGEAHVAIGVELVGGAMIAPSVQRLNFYAKTRITLTRFVATIPCFGAILVSLQKPPLVTFDINCGPGVGNAIEAWLKPFLTNNILGNMLVWPNRIVVPLLPEETIGSYETLNLTTRGILRVRCISASNLKKADLVGKGDPFVLLETVPLQPAKTRVIKNTDSPYWDEEKFLKVQEIEQMLRVEVQDWDPAIVGALTLQTVKLQGRCLISIEELPPGEMVDKEFDLGIGDWGLEGGPGTGYGKIHLQITYLPLAYLRSGQIAMTSSGAEQSDDDEDEGPSVQKGIVFVLVEKGHNLMSGTSGGKTDPYCVLWLGDVKKQTEAKKDVCDPVWNENFDWPNISCTDILYLEVYDKGAISDKVIGRGSIEMSVLATEFSKDEVRQPLQTNISLEGGKGDVVLRMEWVPLDHNPIVRSRSVILPSLFGECNRGVLQARLVKAKDLENMDIVGLSDPYCILKIGGNEKRSKIIHENLNPVWNETFVWKGCRPQDSITVICMDEDPFKDDTLGMFEIPLSQVLDPVGVVHTFCCSLYRGKKKKRAKGQITIQMLFVPTGPKSSDLIPEEPEWPIVED